MSKHELDQELGQDAPEDTVERGRQVDVPSTREALALPATVDVPTAARFFGLGRPAAYRACRDGTLPFEVVRVGKRLRVTRANLLHALGVPDADVQSGAGPRITGGESDAA